MSTANKLELFLIKVINYPVISR